MLLLKVKKPGSGGRGDNTSFDCFHQVGYGLLNSRKFVFHGFNVKLMVFLLEVSNGAVYDEVYGFIVQAVHHNGPRHSIFNHIPADGFLFTGVFQPVLLTGVVIMHFAGLAGARDPDHIAPAMPTVQFAGQKIVFCPVAGASIAIILFHAVGLLCIVEKLITDDARHSTGDADVAVHVNAAVSIVVAEDMEAAFVPFAPSGGLDSTGIEVIGYAGKKLPSGDSRINLSDNGGFRLINFGLAVGTALIAKRETAIDKSLFGIIVQAALHILGHVFDVELVDIHHRSQSEAPGGIVVKIFFGIKDLDTAIHQAALIYQRLHHVAAYSVAFPCQHIGELVLLGIPHHTLERGTLVRFAADRAVFIGGGDGQPQFCGVLSAGFNLLFDGNVPLIVGRIAGVDDRIAAVCLLFFAHKNTSGYTLTSLPGGGTITSARSVIALDRFYPVPSLSKLI